MYNISSAVFSLQSETSSLNDKITALRFLKHYLSTDNEIDSYNRKRINQLVLDSILKIILGEDRTTNARKQQLVRTEVFVILASLLNSNVLFGDVLSNPDVLAKTRLSTLKTLTTQHIEPLVNTQTGINKTDVQVNSQTGRRAPTTGDKIKSSSSDRSLGSFNPSVTTPHDDADSHRGSTQQHSLSEWESGSSHTMRSDATLKLKHLMPGLLKNPRKLMSKTQQPRASVLFGDRLEPSHLVPGADPYNYIEQDRKLGYQKPRMWFPAPGIGNDANMLPPDRQSASKSATDRVVEEYLQMRALASYVGDLVMPFEPPPLTAPPSGKSRNPNLKQASTAGASGFDSSNSSVVSMTSSRLSGFTDVSRFNAAMKEAAAIWSPLLGVHLPPWMKNNANPLPTVRESHHREMRVFKQLRFQDEESEDTYSDTLSQLRSLDEESNMSSVDKDSLVTEDRRRVSQVVTPYSNARIVVAQKVPHPDWVNADEEEEESSFEQMQRYQSEVKGDFQRRKDELAQSLRSSEALIQATINAQYALLPPNYIVLLEGSKANARKLIANTLFIFCRVKRRNLLALAVGVWKICLVEQISIANRPKYARTAALYLMASWAIRAKMKNLRSWLAIWRRSVSILVFNERTASTVVVQKLYRTWRDKRRFLQMHLAGTYNGILSDVYLGPQRVGVQYTIPQPIRSTRRMLWMAAIIIQSKFRCWIESRVYLHKRKLLVRLQSVIRMYPKWCQYRRLKTATIKCQAWSRRTVKRRWFKILRRATIVIQKYVRRHLSYLRRQRISHAIWRTEEERMAAVIRIQCRWRIRCARKKIRGQRFQIKMRHYSALVIQRNYYRFRKAFHTFFLMCVLSAREAEDKMMERLSVTMGRRQCARRIQRFYKMRYFKRNITAVVRVQCWFRGRQGYNIVDILRRQRWATRKLHHWARGMVYRRHRLVRKIQRWWWRLKKGRLLKHLWHRMAVMDRMWDLAVSEDRYHAAGKIQAYVKGSWDRRWVRRHRAATRIQKNFRFFNGLRRWRNWKREKILKGVRRYVGQQLDRGINTRVRALLKRHSRMLTKPQALIRGFVVRSIFKRMRKYAYVLGLSAVLIQRFWRKTGAMSRAVEEVMALRRMESNPFKACECVHEVLLIMRSQCTNYYSAFDPRVGLRVSSLLFRLGCIDLLEMFPRRDFLYVSDLQGLNMERMHALFNSWRAMQQKQKSSGTKKKTEEDDGPRNKRPKPPPVQIFQAILDIVTPPLFTQKKSHLDAIQQILTVQEHLSPSRMTDFAKKLFLKKFGKHLLSRAQNVSREIIELAWTGYNNYKAFGAAALTKAQLAKAVTNASESSHVLVSLEEVRQKHLATASDERKWDKERVFKCAELLQLAIDQTKNILPPGPLLALIDRAIARVSSHRRKMVFLANKYKQHGKKSISKSKSKVSTTTSVSQVNTRMPTSDTSTDGLVDTNASIVRANPLDNLGVALSVSDSVDMPFSGDEEDLDLEQNVSACKIYLEVLDRLYTATSGVQSLKNFWNNCAVKRAIAAERVRVFLEAATKNYIKEQHVDKVKIVWNKFRRAELSAQKLKLIIQAIKDRQAAIEAELAYIPREGWQSFEDEYGYTYWTDMTPGRALETSYDLPTYSYFQWMCAVKIQHLARHYLVAAVERHRLREEIKQAEIAATRARLEEEIRLGAKQVGISLFVRSVPLHGPSSHRHHRNKDRPSVVPDIESMMPWRCQFEHAPDFRSGSWALLRHHSASPDVEDRYDIVMVFKVRLEKHMCDVRTVKGTRTRNINMNRLFQMNMDIGTQVEARNKGRKLFYRGLISHIDDGHSFHPVFTVRYEDGEVEVGMGRDVLRPTVAAMNEFMEARKQLLPKLRIQHKRMVHFAALKRERIARFAAGNATAVDAFVIPVEEEDETKGEEDEGVNASESHVVEYVPSDEQDGESVGDRSQLSMQSELQQSVVSETTFNFNQQTRVTFEDKETEKETEISVAVPVETRSLPLTRINVKFRVKFTRFPMLHGWTEQRDDATGQVYYLHEESGDATQDKPSYSAEQTYLVTKIQAAYHLHRARKMVRRKVLSFSMESIMHGAVERGSKIAYVGYGMEGVTTMQVLRRAGCWELADAIEQFYKNSKQLNLSTLTIEQIIEKHKENFETIGILQTNHLRDAKELQTWWKRVSPADREKKLTLFNYFSGPDDRRTIQQVIYDRREVLIEKFLRVFKSTQSRTRLACMSIVEDSLFPHSTLQVEMYVKRYADKPELARDSVYELISKPTTHTWVEERVVYRIYRDAARIVAAILNNLKLARLHRVVRDAEKRADMVMKEVLLLQSEDKPRPHCTGPEAKAALILRTQVFYFLTRYIQAVVVIQRKARSYHLAKVWKVYLSARVLSTSLIQRTIRRCLAYKVARGLRAQQISEWEQLWDSKRRLLYYYNRIANYSTYEEPEGPFRPLVRDPRSAVLVQAWPEMGGGDRLSGDVDTPNPMSIVPKNAMCGICNTRKCVRVCYDCGPPIEADEDPYSSGAKTMSPYCFTCFIKEHTEDNHKLDHSYDVLMGVEAADPQTQLVLLCSMCQEPATRKCMGALDDEQIDSICTELRLTDPDKWAAVLQKFNVAGDRKISILLDQMRDTDEKHSLIASQLQEVRALLERTRAECDECYCASCYAEVHSGGKRAMHRWKGFLVSAPVCTVCANSPAETRCLDCESEYCESCFLVFHGMGRKRRHKKERLTEGLDQGQIYCSYCQRRAADVHCPNERCEVSACDSCYEFAHKTKCDKTTAFVDKRKQSAKNQGHVSHPCVVCGDPADKLCTQCGDAYCSKTWMGNPGCFVSFHNKGNRATHTTQPLRKMPIKRKTGLTVL